MAKRGPVGTEAPARRNETGAKSVGAPPTKYPPLPGAANYLPQTIAWYEGLATSPQASLFAATDWMRIHMLAPLVDLYWQNPSKDLMAEIRQNESKLGVTLEDRQRLRIKIDAPKDPEASGETKKRPSRQRKDPRS